MERNALDHLYFTKEPLYLKTLPPEGLLLGSQILMDPHPSQQDATGRNQA